MTRVLCRLKCWINAIETGFLALKMFKEMLISAFYIALTIASTHSNKNKLVPCCWALVGWFYCTIFCVSGFLSLSLLLNIENVQNNCSWKNKELNIQIGLKQDEKLNSLAKSLVSNLLLFSMDYVERKISRILFR